MKFIIQLDRLLLKLPKRAAVFFRNSFFYSTSFVRYNILCSRRDICLELGSGPRHGCAPWLTLDQSCKADIPWDLRNGIPLKNDSVERIYSSHLFEHVPFEGQQNLLRECLRVLKPGGEFSICVPNARLYLEAYSSNRYFKSTGRNVWMPGWPCNNSLMDQVNYIAYMAGQHNYLFDEDNLLKMLALNGFASPSLRDFDSSVDLIGRKDESIYATAHKPL